MQLMPDAVPGSISRQHFEQLPLQSPDANVKPYPFILRSVPWHRQPSSLDTRMLLETGFATIPLVHRQVHDS